jgi:heme/copper-type cytochrome/quinol oxidase subunit 4
MMNTHSLTSLVFSVLLALTSLYTSAEELVGKIIEDESSSQSLPQAETPQFEPLVDQQKNPQVAAGIDAQIKQHFDHFTPPSPESLSAGFNEMLLIPVVAIIVVIGGGFLFIIALVVTRYRALAQKRVQHQELIQKFLDAGRDVPEELLTDFDGKSQANLSKGIKETFIGLALMVFLTVLIGFEIGAVGLIVIAAGLSRLAIWKLSQPKKSV